MGDTSRRDDVGKQKKSKQTDRHKLMEKRGNELEILRRQICRDRKGPIDPRLRYLIKK